MRKTIGLSVGAAIGILGIAYAPACATDVLVGAVNADAAGAAPPSTASEDGATEASAGDASPDSTGDASQGCGANLENDSLNCGACGHDCQGAACVAGQCQPIVLAPLVSPIAFALYGANIYFTQLGPQDAGATWANSTVSKIAKTGGAPVVLATVTTGGGLAADADNVYVGGENTVMSVPVLGGSVATFATIPDQVVGIRFITLDNTSVYWTAIDGTLESAPKNGGGPVATLASGAFYLAAYGTQVYFTNSSTGPVLSVPLAGGSPTQLLNVAPLQPTSIAVDATNAYVLALGVNSMVIKFNLTTGNTSVLAEPATPSYLAVDASNVYWGDDDRIERVPIGGGAVTTLAAGQNYVGPVAVDDVAVYWVDVGTPPNYTDGALMKVAK